MAGNYTYGTLFKQINDILEKNANNLLRKQEITVSQAGVLVLLEEKEDHIATFKELEKSFGVSQPTMAGLLNRLEQKDLVAILEDPADKRIRKAQLTRQGADKCKEGYKHMKETEERFLRNLTSAEKSELMRLLIKVRMSLE